MKIVYCLDNIHQIGGIENVIREKANYLSNLKEMDIYIIVTDYNLIHQIDLDKKVKFFSLDINYSHSDWKSLLHFLYSLTIKRIKHFFRLSKLCKRINPDIIISTGLSEKFLLPFIKGNHKLIREYHFSKNYRKLAYGERNFFYKLIVFLAESLDNNIFIKKYDRIVTLTLEDKDTNWKGFSNVQVINNPIRKLQEKQAPLINKKIIAVGRLVEQKNFSSLINSFAIVKKKFPDWSLNIYGDGYLKSILQKQIIDLDLTKNVFLKGNSINISEEMLDSSLLVLSSKYEGMPLVILEAMACGLPVISYDCPCGPKDLIKNDENGYLVPLNDENQLAQKICLLIENQELRNKMGSESLKLSERYSFPNVMSQWVQLFESLLN
ncbi:MAG: glycosyltransferase family 4 protein [Muribaculaceae bacterium]|nr:glycosyltransferase family 4 protein [Muribaculaceae bacterium]